MTYKENENLKAKLKHRNCVDCSNHGAKVEVMKLKSQIEKMKCCENCKHYKYTWENSYDCDLGIIDKWETYHKKCNKWEFTE